MKLQGKDRFRDSRAGRADMISPVTPDHLGELFDIVNDGAYVYQGVIPADCWHEPYMSMDELQGELAAGVEFWGWQESNLFRGVMGRQDRGEVVLIRHAYVRRACQQQGIGSRLLDFLRAQEKIEAMNSPDFHSKINDPLLYYKN